MKEIFAGLMLFPMETTLPARPTCGFPWGWCGPMSAWGGFMSLFWLVALALVIYVVVTYGKNKGSGAAGHHDGRALEILKERYAKGEITKEQFDQMKKDIEG